MEPAIIGNLGERYVVANLQKRGYQCHHNTKAPGKTDIEAKGILNSLLVQVKTGTSPNAPAQLTSLEEFAIVQRAQRLGWQAWLAQVQLNADMTLQSIRWSQLD